MSSSTIVDRPLDTAISDALTDLALDLRWSFNHSADQLWEQLDPELWELTHNPWVLLQTVSREKLQTVTSDPDFKNSWLISTARKRLPKSRKRGFKRRIRVRACRRLRISRWSSC